ncbi:MAG TPA: SIS domain-containing protein [Gemmatimonadaceae bacterium]|nr:SIS domain-containing protein [Gemmatimonadaceae bacterium]
MPSSALGSRAEVTSLIRDGLEELSRLASDTSSNADSIASFVERYCDTLRRGGTLFFVGNGGSAADAQHMATEYVVRYRSNRRPFAALALTTDTSLLTATGNDLSFDEIFSRQVEALARPGDLLILHSTSGESSNLVYAVEAARAKGVSVVALLGKGGGRVKALVDEAIVVDSRSTSHIQEIHLAIQHLICEAVENQLLAEDRQPTR